MTAFTVADGTDWIDTLVFGGPEERWRLSDWEVAMVLREVGNEANSIALSTETAGGLTIADDRTRRLEINVSWADIESLGPGPFEFDLLFSNPTTGIKRRSERHTLTITPAITPAS